MRALLLAAGFGMRLRPLTNSMPKCLVPIRGKPLLSHWFDLLLSNGVDRILVNTHYMAEAVRNFVVHSEWRDYVEIVHENNLLGTGGTILQNRRFLEDRPFIVGHADNLTRFDVQAFIRSHEKRPKCADITMMTFHTDSPQSCGIVEIDDLGVVLKFHEKVPTPPSNQANAAVYIFEPTVINFIDSLGKQKVDISTEVLPNYLGRISTFHNSNYHRDIGTLQSLRLAEIEF